MSTVLIAIALGYVIGLMQKGININISEKKDKPKEQEYNKSTSNMLPEEVQKYLRENNGMIKF